MTGGKEERINLEIKLISSPAPIIVRKETFASPLFNGKEGYVHMKSMTSELPLPLPWRESKSGLCLEKKGEVFLK